MKGVEQQSDFPEDLEDFKVACLPIVSNFCQNIGITEMVDKSIESPENINSGQVVVGMIMDTICGRSPLYKLHEFFRGEDLELLFGSELEPADFNDNNVGKVLDNIHAYGSSKLFSQISWKACQNYDLQHKHMHYDTTSVSVYGDYNGREQAMQEAMEITHGYSKDHRPDLKQFMMDALCIEGNIPILGAVLDGNTSDKKANHRELTEIASFMKKNGIDPMATVYIADSALVNEENLKKLEKQPFITRLPGTYNVEKQSIENAFELNQWQEIGALAEIVDPSANRKSARYKIAESQVEVYGQHYRAIVVHSSAHDKRRQKKLSRTIEQEQLQFKKLCKQLSKMTWHCQKDAQQYVQNLPKQHRFEYHQLQVQMLENEIYARGRPRQNESRKVEFVEFKIQTQLIELEDKIELIKEKSGCFVLITNLPHSGNNAHGGKEILKAYKDQYGIEMNFRFLKDPVIVNHTFLKKPQRIEALGVILLLSLMVWNLIEHVIRKYIKKHNRTIMGWDNKQTHRPTSLMVIFYFQHVSIFAWNDRCKRRLSRKLKDHQLDYLMAMGLSESIFTTPVRTFKNA